VNTAVASMNQVTQQNAANSEESASAAEELSSQARELANMVGTFALSDTVGGRRSAQASNYAPQKHLTSQQSFRKPVIAALPDKSKKAPPAKAPATKAVNASEIIPLDDDELSEF